jgi:hypothetical protein
VGGGGAEEGWGRAVERGQEEEERYGGGHGGRADWRFLRGCGRAAGGLAAWRSGSGSTAWACAAAAACERRRSGVWDGVWRFLWSLGDVAEWETTRMVGALPWWGMEAPPAPAWLAGLPPGPSFTSPWAAGVVRCACPTVKPRQHMSRQILFDASRAG